MMDGLTGLKASGTQNMPPLIYNKTQNNQITGNYETYAGLISKDLI